MVFINYNFIYHSSHYYSFNIHVSYSAWYKIHLNSKHSFISQWQNSPVTITIKSINTDLNKIDFPAVSICKPGTDVQTNLNRCYLLCYFCVHNIISYAFKVCKTICWREKLLIDKARWDVQIHWKQIGRLEQNWQLHKSEEVCNDNESR